MHPHPLTQGWDVYLFGAPLIALLFFGYFRLDETFTTKKRTPNPPPRQAPVIDPEGSSMCTDPDGRPWEKRVSRRGEKTAWQ